MLNVFSCRQKEVIKESDVFSSDKSEESEDDDVEIDEYVLFLSVLIIIVNQTCTILDLLLLKST